MRKIVPGFGVCCTRCVGIIIALLVFAATSVMAQNSAGDYTAGTTALTTVAEQIALYVPIVVKLCYAIAGVVAIVGAISVYIAMNNEEQDVKKKIMMVVGACIFLIATTYAHIRKCITRCYTIGYKD
ncbi:MAG: DUF4134 domain-containing protein [Prevotella sp.]|nr:DUF4134 domain-containing protein [Prevotella sp.]